MDIRGNIFKGFKGTSGVDSPAVFLFSERACSAERMLNHVVTGVVAQPVESTVAKLGNRKIGVADSRKLSQTLPKQWVY